MDELRSGWNWQQGSVLPAWVLSISLHCGALTTLGLGVPTTEQEAAQAATREGSIVLVSRSSGKDEYFSDETEAIINPAAVRPVSFDQPAVIGVVLPSAPQPVEAAALPVAVPASANLITSGSGR